MNNNISVPKEMRRAMEEDMVNTLIKSLALEVTRTTREYLKTIIRDVRPADFIKILDELADEDGRLAYKTPLERIIYAIKAAAKVSKDELSIVSTERAEFLYSLLYQIKKQITATREVGKSALQKFEEIDLKTIRMSQDSLPALDKINLASVTGVGKKWIYDHVDFDRSLFISRLKNEIKSQIILDSVVISGIHSIAQKKPS